MIAFSFTTAVEKHLYCCLYLSERSQKYLTVAWRRNDFHTSIFLPPYIEKFFHSALNVQDELNIAVMIFICILKRAACQKIKLIGSLQKRST